MTEKMRDKIMCVRVEKLIYLHGSRLAGYTITVNGFDGMGSIFVNSAEIGHAIVRALRSIAAAKPDYFPPSKREAM